MKVKFTTGVSLKFLIYFCPSVFRLILKIKWGQSILNSLRFPAFFKQRKPYARLQMIDIVIKRLALTRFSMIHTINSYHNSLMTMLHGLSLQLDAKVSKAQNVSEIIRCHKAFVRAFSERSFMGEKKIQRWLMETLKLASILRDEWKNVIKFAMLDQTDSLDTISLRDLDKNAIEIEKAFGACENELKYFFGF